MKGVYPSMGVNPSSILEFSVANRKRRVLTRAASPRYSSSQLPIFNSGFPLNPNWKPSRIVWLLLNCVYVLKSTRVLVSGKMKEDAVKPFCIEKLM